MKYLYIRMFLVLTAEFWRLGIRDVWFERSVLVLLINLLSLGVGNLGDLL